MTFDLTLALSLLEEATDPEAAIKEINAQLQAASKEIKRKQEEKEKESKVAEARSEVAKAMLGYAKALGLKMDASNAAQMLEEALKEQEKEFGKYIGMLDSFEKLASYFDKTPPSKMKTKTVDADKVIFDFLKTL